MRFRSADLEEVPTEIVDLVALDSWMWGIRLCKHRTRPTVSPSCLKMPLVPIQVTCSIVCNKCTHPGSPSTINQPPGFLFTAHQDLPTKIFTIYLASVTQATRTDFGVKSKPIIVVQFLIQFLSVFWMHVRFDCKIIAIQPYKEAKRQLQ